MTRISVDYDRDVIGKNDPRMVRWLLSCKFQLRNNRSFTGETDIRVWRKVITSVIARFNIHY